MGYYQYNILANGSCQFSVMGYYQYIVLANDSNNLYKIRFGTVNKTIMTNSEVVNKITTKGV